MRVPYGLRHTHGFTYIGLLIMVAVIGVAATATLQLGSVLQRRTAEDELLAIGAEFRAALISYANATPVGQKRMPDAIDDLLRDDRFPTPRRHLRKRYVDPLTGNDEWGTLRASGNGGIAGIYSLSTAKPLKIGNFAPPFQAFEGTTSYQRWIFGDLSVLPPALPGQNAAP